DSPGSDVVPGGGVRDLPVFIDEFLAEVAHPGHGPQARHQVGQIRDLVAAVESLPVPQVSVGGEEHLRFELAEFRPGTFGRVVLGAGGPDGTERGGGEEGDERAVGAREGADDTVAWFDSLRTRPGGGGSGLAAPRAPGGL